MFAAASVLMLQPAPARAGAELPARDSEPEAVDPPLPEKDQGPRPLPEYRLPPSTAARHLLWMPRVLLTPVYVACHLVATPVAAVATVAERYHWRQRLRDVFTFGSRDQFGVYPAGYVDLGFRPTVGLYSYWQDPLRPSDMHLRVTSGGGNHWDARWLWQSPLGAGALELMARYSERDDRAFHGLGRQSSSTVARYGERGVEAQLSYRLSLGPALSVTSRVAQEAWAFDPGPRGYASASLARALAEGQLAAPPALDGGLVALTTGARLDLDTRRGRVLRRPRTEADYAHVAGGGVALHGNLAAHWGLRPTRAEPDAPSRLPAWLSYGGTLTGTLDLTGTQRRLDLELFGSFTDPWPGAGDVPFTHAVSLGGARPMRGFGAQRFMDRSAVVGTLRYRWPVWQALDGSLHAAAGNVFGPWLRGLSPEELRASFGVGMATATSTTQAFEVLLAFGTRPFRDGAAVESTRLAVGTTLTF